MGGIFSSWNTENYVEEVDYSDIEENIESGDLAVLYREGQDVPHYAVFIRPLAKEGDHDFPLLLIKGKTKPLPKEEFTGNNSNERNNNNIHFTTAVNRIFYGDFKKVVVKQLDYPPEKRFPFAKMLGNIEKVNKIPFSEYELEVIKKASTPEERSAVLNALSTAHFYDLMMPGVCGDPSKVTPQSLEGYLKLKSPKSIKLPPVRPGQLTTLQHQLTSAPHHPLTFKPYDELASTLNTGDIMLFSGKSNASEVIKFFDNAQFSHVGIVIRSRYTSELMSWESTPEKGLHDIESGEIRNGVQLLPVRYQIFSGVYDRIAFRRLTGVTEEQREKMSKELLRLRKKLQGTPYDWNFLVLIRSSLDWDDERFSWFVENSKEDLSSLFCSELVASAYKHMGLLETEVVSSEFTPDDFTSARDHKLSLKFGKLEPEEYVDLRYPNSKP